MKAGGTRSDEHQMTRSPMIRALTAFTRSAQWTPRVAILGAGPGGLNSAYKLQKAGIDTFTIYERQDGVGGVWRQNTYPGAACDVMSHFYSFSFELKKDWTETYATQPEILSYFEHVAEQYDLKGHLRTGVNITGLQWDDEQCMWSIHTRDGEVFNAHFVISCLGLFTEPKFP